MNRRDVSGWAFAVVGQVVCKNGKAAFRDCDTVMKRNVCAGFIYCRLVQTENQYTALGDSGGPWYYGYTAYGITMGYHWDPVWPFARSLFSEAGLMDNAPGVHINSN